MSVRVDTRQPLPWLAIAFAFVAVLLVGATRELAEWWESQRPHTVADVGMPIAKIAAPWHEPDVVMSVFHEAPAGSPCKDEICALDGHWHVVLSVRGEQLGTRTSLDEPRQVHSRRASLSEVAETKADPSVVARSEATVAIRCPANAPYEVARLLMLDVARSNLYRIEYAVTAADPSVNRLLSACLRNDPAAIMFGEDWHPGIRVLLERNRVDGGCERCVEDKRRGFPHFADESDIPGEVTRLVEGAAGDAKLTERVRAALRRDAETEVRIRAKFDVPFQAIVDAIDVLHAAGVEQIDFEDPR